MRRMVALLGLLLAVSALSASTAVAAPQPLLYSPSLRVDIDLFYDDLAPYGDWIEYQDYGWAWVPRVDADWRPYTIGRWAWTDEYGWMWVSDEPFGWATYHYGRWIEDADYGWVWIPGYEWGPAWVSWRMGDDAVGWAPLPPRFRWDDDEGFRFASDDFDRYIPARDYCFVPERSFVSFRVHQYLLPRSYSTRYVRMTRNVTDYRPSQGRVFNRGIDVDRLQRTIDHAVPRVRPVDVTSVRDVHHAQVQRGEVPVFRPAVQPRADRVPPAARQGQPQPGRGQQIYERDRWQLERQNAQEREQLERQHQQELNAARRGGAPATAVREEQAREQQQRQLERQQAQERIRVEQQHQQELQRAQHQHTYDAELARRQEEQHRAVDERQAQQRQQLEAQQEQARRLREQQVQAQSQAQADVRSRQYREEAQRRAAEMAQRQQQEHQAMVERQNQQRQQMQSEREQARQQQEQHHRDQPPPQAHPQQPHDDHHKDKPQDKDKDKDHAHHR
jgi:hypothetical protein